MSIIENYNWLAEIDHPPRMIEEFLKLYGVHEVPGDGDNPVIMQWAKEVDVTDVYGHDSIAWCGLAMAIFAKRAGKQIPDRFLWALNWCYFGQKVGMNDGGLGDVLVFTRKAGGHVGLYIGEDVNAFHVGGGNENDAVNIVRIAKDRLYCVRRPVWKVKQPESVKKMYLASNGKLSLNEA